MRPTHERESLRMFDGLHGDIDVEIRPVEMAWASKLHVPNSADRRLTKPGEEFETQTQLASLHEQPKSLLGDAGNFSD
jgi:hypothetical protein